MSKEMRKETYVYREISIIQKKLNDKFSKKKKTFFDYMTNKMQH